MLERLLQRFRRDEPDETPFVEAIAERADALEGASKVVPPERSERILEAFRQAQRTLERRHVNVGHRPERRGA